MDYSQLASIMQRIAALEKQVALLLPPAVAPAAPASSPSPSQLSALVAQHFVLPAPDGPTYHFTTGEIASRLKLVRPSLKAVGKALQGLGFAAKPMRVGYAVRTRYAVNFSTRNP